MDARLVQLLTLCVMVQAAKHSERSRQGLHRKHSKNHNLAARSQNAKKEYHIKFYPRDKYSVIPVKYFNSPPGCNIHRHKYIINNPKICRSKHDTFLLILIRSALVHAPRRAAIRESWGASYNFPRISMPVVFLLGATNDSSLQADILQESQIYQDIVQEDFVDSYQNLTLKTVMAYKWAHRYCPKAHYVMVANDNVMVDMFKMVPYLQLHEPNPEPRFLVCYLYPCCMQATQRHQKLPRQSRMQYEGKTYPAYCSGSVYVLPWEMVRQLFLVSLDTPAFMPDDAWVGVLAEKLSIGFMDTYRSFVGIGKRPDVMQAFNSSTYLHGPLLAGVLDFSKRGSKESEMIRSIWGTIIRKHRYGPRVEVRRYMRMEDPSADSHIYNVALAAVVLDLAVMAVIVYLVFKRRRRSK